MIDPQQSLSQRLSEECHVQFNDAGMSTKTSKSVVFIRADVDDCPTSAKEFDIEVFLSIIFNDDFL